MVHLLTDLEGVTEIKHKMMHLLTALREGVTEI